MKWHGAWLYHVHRMRLDGGSFMWHQPWKRCKYTTLVDIQERRYEKLVIHVQSQASAVSLLESGEQCYIKAINNNNNLPLGVGIIIILIILLLSQNKPLGLLLSNGGHGIFNVHNHLGVCCAHKRWDRHVLHELAGTSVDEEALNKSFTLSCPGVKTHGSCFHCIISTAD